MSLDTSAHNTLKKFGYPESCIHNYENWAVVLRPRQITLGSLVMICKQDVISFSEISNKSFSEMQKVIKDIEKALKEFSEYDKINYLTLMMVDPHVHSHVLPRYEGIREFDDITFPDTCWPGPPDVKAVTDMPDQSFDALLAALKYTWPQ